MKQTLKWKLAHSRTLHGVLSDWIPASVPGCVQMDMAAAAGLPLYFTGDHEEEYAYRYPDEMKSKRGFSL